jgi:hypothetical protein
MRPPLRVLWREAHATGALAAGLVSSLPASAAAALVFAVHDAIYHSTTLRYLGAGELALGAIWGAIFGVLVAFTAHHLPPLAGTFWGALYGLTVWLVWFVLILPLMQPELAGHTRLGLAAHLAFGAVLGATFHVVRVSERRKHRSSAPPAGSGGSAGPPR